jgi:hypothetical protein
VTPFDEKYEQVKSLLEVKADNKTVASK